MDKAKALKTLETSYYPGGKTRMGFMFKLR